MTNGSELKGVGAMALRAAGFKPCPRVWLTDEQLDLVMYMARQNDVEVNRIRTAAKTAPAVVLPKDQQIELAWRRHR